MWQILKQIFIETFDVTLPVTPHPARQRMNAKKASRRKRVNASAKRRQGLRQQTREPQLQKRRKRAA